MLEMSRYIYTGGNLKEKLSKKIDRNLILLFPIIILKVNGLVPFFFCEYILRSLLARLTFLHTENTD